MTTLRLLPYGTLKDGVSTSFIDFGNGTEDRIDFKIENRGSSVICTKVWYNETLVWEDAKDPNDSYFEIIK